MDEAPPEGTLLFNYKVYSGMRAREGKRGKREKEGP